MRDLTELNKLEKYLKEHEIDYARIDEDNAFKFDLQSALRQTQINILQAMDRHQIIVGGDKEPGACDWDVICHNGSYGCDEGLLEGMGSIFEDELEGWLTADDVIVRIEKSEGKS